MRSRLGGLIALIFVAALAVAQDVPKQYQDLYSMLDRQVSAFDRKVSNGWDGKPADVAFSAKLLTANCNRGRQLLDPRTFEAAKMELDRLQSLGVKAVTFCIGFPLFYKPFLQFNGDPQDYDRFVNFYRSLSNEIHRRGMKLVVETSVLFPGVYSQGAGLNLAPYYKTLDGRAIAGGRAEQAKIIVREVKPDFLNLGSESDTQARLTGRKLMAVPQFYAKEIAYIVQQLRAAGTGNTRIGAGAGTWQHGASETVAALCRAGVDFIDLHVYPVTRDMLDNLITLTDQAQRCGKPVAISEAWLQKERDSELDKIDATSDPEFYARDSFSFWSPLDQKFLTALVKFSHWKHVMYLSPFWSKFFWGYLDYKDAANMSKEELLQASTKASAAALQKGDVSPTGAAYSKAIAAK